jgi:hypothetical protein
MKLILVSLATGVMWSRLCPLVPWATRPGAPFATASVVDPFGNILGLMYNPHYLEILSELTS